MITVKDIARLCNVSPGTVSNIINGRPNVGEETRERVLRVIQETGYQPNYFASSMRKQSSRTIGIIVEDLKQFTTTPIVVTIMAYCEEMGYRTILLNLRMYDRWQDTWFQDEKMLESALIPALKEITAIRVDGLIYVAGHGRTLSCFPEDFKIPTVIAYATSENDRYPSILIDAENAGYDMGKYLLSKRHTKISVIAGVSDNMHSDDRLAGFRRALSEAGVVYHPEWTFHGTWLRESGYLLAEKALGTGATAIWCMNDQMAAGVYDYVYESGMVIGKDISIAGFDNMENAEYMYPRLTTNGLPLRRIGRRSAETMIHMLEEEGWRPEEMRTWIRCQMTEGNSVADIREKG